MKGRQTEIRDFRLLRHAHQLRHGRGGKESLWLLAGSRCDDAVHRGFAAYRLDEVVGV